MLSEADSGPGAAQAGQYVFAVVDGRAARRTVQVGLSDDSNQEILKGLGVGDVVAIGPARVLRELRDGDRVAPVKAAPMNAAPQVAGAPR